MIVVADTSGVIAASDRHAPEAPGCRNAMREAGTVVVSPLVMTEVDHMAKVRFGSAAGSAIIDFILEQASRLRFHIPETGVGILTTARSVQRRYADLNLDFADAVNVALAAEYKTDTLLTLDRRDFRAVRPFTEHKAFRLLPDDA